jgi:3-oxoacyl-[acyl-carrier protein] reductase
VCHGLCRALLTRRYGALAKPVARTRMSDPHAHAELAGQTAVVAGASGGIGRAIALELAAAGAAVVLHAGRNVGAAQSAAGEIAQRGGAALVVPCDLTDVAESESLVETAWQWRQGVDIWVHCAGADVLTGDSAAWSFERKLERLWQVDVAAAMRLGRLVGGRMKARRRGVIVTFGWDGVERGMPGDGGQLFAAVKGAIHGFTRSLAASLAPEVRVNCIAPGWIQTAWGRQASDHWQQRARRECLLGRWGAADDVAGAVRWLVSPSAAFVTGQVLAINGGFRFSADPPRDEPGSGPPPARKPTA